MSLASRLQREWLAPGLLSRLLLPLSWLYGAVVRWRAAHAKPEALPVPVVVVGNWIVGGAGKTPTTLALLRLLSDVRAGVVSRGYGRKSDAVHLVTRNSSAREAGDEPLLIHLRTGAPVAVGRDRVAAARALLQAHPDLQLLISDDGLQHLRLPHDLSVIVFDERGLGNTRLLPAGPLREPPRPLRDGELVLYNASQPSTSLPGHLGHRAFSGAVALDAWWRGEPARLETLRALRGQPLLAAAGMAQPQRFFDMLTEQGLSFAPLPLSDHHDFATLPWPSNTPHVLITEKDAVKLRPEALGTTQAWVVALDFHPDSDFERLLRERVQQLLH